MGAFSRGGDVIRGYHVNVDDDENISQRFRVSVLNICSFSGRYMSCTLRSGNITCYTHIHALSRMDATTMTMLLQGPISLLDKNLIVEFFILVWDDWVLLVIQQVFLLFWVFSLDVLFYLFVPIDI